MGSAVVQPALQRCHGQACAPDCSTTPHLKHAAPAVVRLLLNGAQDSQRRVHRKHALLHLQGVPTAGALGKRKLADAIHPGQVCVVCVQADRPTCTPMHRSPARFSISLSRCASGVGTLCSREGCSRLSSTRQPLTSGQPTTLNSHAPEGASSPLLTTGWQCAE